MRCGEVFGVEIFDWGGLMVGRRGGGVIGWRDMGLRWGLASL